jgi:hypothetical protein
MMLGTVLATLKASAVSLVPRAAARTMLRPKPSSREITVPAAMTALLRARVPGAVSLSGSGSGPTVASLAPLASPVVTAPAP